ncbi:MAG: hypothetical protein R6U65_07215 [Perlabentimonas sp.]
MKRVKHILNILLSGYLLVVMGGLTVFTHTCSCNNKTSTSLYVENSCCSGEHETSTCEAPGGTCEANSCNKCTCKTKVEVYTTDHTITSEIKTNILARQTLRTIINSTIKFELPKNIVTSSFQEFKEKVPPKAGRYLHILFQNLKIPFPNS